MFRHHLESTINHDLDFTYKHLRSLGLMEELVKVRFNHIGQIVHVGEY